jgi:hypothetical protein
MDKTIKPEEIVNLNEDYYGVLGLKKGDLPEGKTTKEREEISEILSKAFRIKARETHPDVNPNGSADEFKKVVRSNIILGDLILRRYYDSGINPILAGDTGVAISWKGTYATGTQQDTLGTLIFLSICKDKENLCLIPAFRPSCSEDNEDHYEWDFVINNIEFKTEENKIHKLCLSLVMDEEEVLRLTSGTDVEESLPFKIYICIPRTSLFFLRDEEEIHKYEDGSQDIMPGILKACTFNDLNLLETTNLEVAQKFIKEELEKKLNDFRSGKLIKEQETKDLEFQSFQMLSSERVKTFDAEMLKAILRMKSAEIKKDAVKNNNAADFLTNLPNNKKRK